MLLKVYSPNNNFQLSFGFSKLNFYFCRNLAKIGVKFMILEFCVSNYLSIKDEL